MFSHHPPMTRTPHQRGAVLIISLIFLLLMTLVGVTAMQGTTMQERMSGNMQDRNVAFQASEAALRLGENWLRENENTVSINTARLPDPAQWDGKDPAPRGLHDNVSDQLHTQPRYHVGEPHIIRRYDGDVESGVCDMYPVVSRAAGRSEATVVVIRTHSIFCN